MKLNKKRFMEKTIWTIFVFSSVGGIPGNTIWYLTIPNNTKQYQNNTYQHKNLPNPTIPITKELGIGWYRLVSNKHQISLPVWSQYHHDIVTIWKQRFCVCLVSSQYCFWQFPLKKLWYLWWTWPSSILGVEKFLLHWLMATIL